MEYRQDYLEAQTDIIAKMLRKLLEKLLNIEPTGITEDELKTVVSAGIVANREASSIEKLPTLEDTLLIKTLREEYGYSNENLRLLADVLYELMKREHDNKEYRRMSLTLYRHYLQESKTHIDFLVFSRVAEMEYSIVEKG